MQEQINLGEDKQRIESFINQFDNVNFTLQTAEKVSREMDMSANTIETHINLIERDIVTVRSDFMDEMKRIRQKFGDNRSALGICYDAVLMAEAIIKLYQMQTMWRNYRDKINHIYKKKSLETIIEARDLQLSTGFLTEIKAQWKEVMNTINEKDKYLKEFISNFMSNTIDSVDDKIQMLDQQIRMLQTEMIQTDKKIMELSIKSGVALQPVQSVKYVKSEVPKQEEVKEYDMEFVKSKLLEAKGSRDKVKILMDYTDMSDEEIAEYIHESIPTVQKIKRDIANSMNRQS